MNTPSFPSYAGTLTYYNPYSGDAVRSREHWLNRGYTIVIVMLGVLVLMVSLLAKKPEIQSVQDRAFFISLPWLGLFMLVGSYRIFQSHKKREEVLPEALAACFGSSDTTLAGQPVGEERLVDLLERGLSAGFSPAEM